MLIEVLAVAIVVLFVAGFLILFNRRRAVVAKAFEEDYPEIKPDESGKPETEESDEGKKTEIFAAVDTSNTQEATGFGYDATGESVVKNLAFEEKLGKDTVVVEIPSTKARRKAPAKAVKAEPKAAPKKDAVKLGATPEEVVKILERKIARRVDVLKVAKVPESGDATLKRYRSKLAELKATIPAASAKAEPVRYMGYEKKPVTSTDNAEVIVVGTVGAEKKASKKSTKAKKPAKKKAPSKKKPAKKTKKAKKAKK